MIVRAKLKPIEQWPESNFCCPQRTAAATGAAGMGLIVLADTSRINERAATKCSFCGTVHLGRGYLLAGSNTVVQIDLHDFEEGSDNG